MPDIKITTDDTLELDTIIEEWENPEGVIEQHSVESNNYELNGFKTHTGVFNPQESGTYEFKINGQLLSIKLTDSSAIPDSEDLHARYDFSQYSGDSGFSDLIGNGYDLTNGSITSVSESINGVQAGEFDGADDGVWSDSFSSFSEATVAIVFRLDSTNGDHTGYQFNTTNFQSFEWQDGKWRIATTNGGIINGSTDSTINIATFLLGDGKDSILCENGTQTAKGATGSDVNRHATGTLTQTKAECV